MHETNEAVTLVMEAADDEAEIIFGTVIDENMDDHVQVTVIATGLQGSEKRIIAEKPIVSTNEVVVTSNPDIQELAEDTNVDTDIAEGTNEVESVDETDHIAERGIEAASTQIVDSANESTSMNESQSTLVSSIKKAASDYMKADTTPKREPAIEKEDTAITYSSGMKRAQSIAEKLGFVAFDEETLDQPAYLRKEEKTEVRQSPSVEV